MVASLAAEHIEEYRQQGYTIVRGLFAEDELEQVATGVLRSVERTDIETRAKLYPEPATQFVLDGRYIEDPGLAYIAAHPFVVEAAQTLLGGPVVLSASVAYVKTPGASGTGADYEGSHPTAHQDFKTYQQAGSSVNWLFAIAPLVDLDEEIGRLAASPGSALASHRVRDGRIWRIERARADEVAPLEDTRLRRGDLLLMNMFSWHEGGANRSAGPRYGIYNKYRARNAPPASGPELFSDRAHELVRYQGQALLPHHGDCGIGQLRLLLECEEQFLLVRGATGWALPGGPLDEAYQPPYVNLVGPAQELGRQRLGLELPWLSYIGDFAADGRLCRVFARPLDQRPELQVAGGAEAGWFTAAQLASLVERGELAGGYEAEAAALWLDPSYMRGMGEAGRAAAQSRGKA